MEEQQEDDSLELSTRWMSSLLIRPRFPSYETLPPPPTRREVPLQARWGEDEPFPGFAEFRKYKKMNETREISKYEPEEQTRKLKDVRDSVSEETPLEVERLMYERIEPIPIDHPGSLVRLVLDYPQLGYLHLMRDCMRIANNYKPYHYVICNYDDVDKDNYSTISVNGMIEFYKGYPHFLTLDRLVQEFKMYQTLCEIPSFKKFRMWKAFMVWYKKIRRRKFVEAREKLALTLVFRPQVMPEFEN